MTQLPELLVPAGNLSKLRVALAYGADAVYVGAAGLSMRPDDASLSVDELHEAARLVRSSGKRLYVGINTLMFQQDLDALTPWLEATRDCPFDGVIVSDPGAFALVRAHRPELPIHISTQLSTANSGAAGFWRDAGASRIVLARECSLTDAAAIARQAGVEIEVFVHGAMCMAVSGRCLMSAYLTGQSGSQGNCKHACRWEWQLVEQKRPGETFPVFETERETIFFGSTDLCLIEHIPQLVQSGIAALKIEGRMKSEHYVAAVTRVYRAALDRYAADPDAYAVESWWLDELEAISHRPYSTGFAFGYPVGRPESLQTHNRPVSTCEVVAIVRQREANRVRLLVKNAFDVDDELEWIGPQAVGGALRVAALFDSEGQPITHAHCGAELCAELIVDAPLPAHAILRRRVAS